MDTDPFPRLVGVRPLLMHSARLADPLTRDHPRPRQDHRKTCGKTAADHEEIARVEWFGGLWLRGWGQALHSGREALESAVRGRRQNAAPGKTSRSWIQVDGPARLFYDGPEDIDELWKQPRFRLRVPVRVANARTMRTRARFDVWNVEFNAAYLPSPLSRSLILDIRDRWICTRTRRLEAKVRAFQVECLS